MRVVFNSKGEIQAAHDDWTPKTKFRKGTFIDVDLTVADLGDVSDWHVAGGKNLIRKSLDGARSNAKRFINSEVAEIRARYISPHYGQDLVYESKRLEAVEYLSRDPAPRSLADFPFIRAEVTAKIPAGQLAQIYLNRAAETREILADLERCRMGYIGKIESAVEFHEIEAIRSRFAAEYRRRFQKIAVKDN